eukprot:CAMPEP_0172537454 /NCGR_PEP_ID=MMETSP1067-20121228/9044_1 /TAXON_ID=265564 ORGANISM="Thalassiosira punctigera, Strain Tpunct2005C2" /NCGR_SAMPLE_ID=MMETSP1067 /ASSEMBLY_ACC=CAM_ASM_000444 /LENGTH=454 /DNA_ID=CAMNT_0013322757 /DNA_START=31 /DNA_END=1395 /DNA_ORIENTATION=-
MANSEKKPLLTSYDSTLSQHPASRLTGGRGKLRFEKRRQMKKNRSIYSSVFSPQSPRQGPRPKTKKVVENAAKSNPLSIDEDLPVDRLNSSKEQPPSKRHSQLYNALNPKSHSSSARLFQKFITIVIIFDVLIYILSTEPGLSHISRFFYDTEAVTSTIFAIEYIARLAVCAEKRGYGKYGPLRGRWKYLCSSQALVDAFATFPFFVELLSGVSLPRLTYLRVFRVLRITRTQSCSQAMDAVCRVFYFNREILHVAALLGMYLVIITSVLLYYLRPRGKDIEYVDDPMDFSSITSTMVMSILMLTGQGGPSGQLPWYTQLVVLLTGIFSVAMFAIPASMLTWGFEAEAERLGMKAKKRALARKRGEVYTSDTSCSSSSGSSISGFGDISTSDEEYMNIIGGGDDNEVEVVQKVSFFGQDEMQPLLTRIERLEQNVAQTNIKLDLILQKLERTNA